MPILFIYILGFIEQNVSKSLFTMTITWYRILTAAPFYSFPNIEEQSSKICLLCTSVM